MMGVMTETFTVGEHRDHKGRFQIGSVGGPGRRTGSRNKLTEQFITDFYTTWQESGLQALRKVRDEDPAAYVRVAASLLPRQAEIDLNVSLDQFSTSDEVLDAVRAELGEAAVLAVQAMLEAEPDAPVVIEHKPHSDVAASLKALRK